MRKRLLASLIWITACGANASPSTVVPAPSASAASPPKATSATPVSEPSVIEKRITSADLLADLAILREAYETLHPGLYRYNSKEQMDTHFRALADEFNRDRTLVEAYLAISTFLAKIKCGHTYANFYNQDKPIVKEVFFRLKDEPREKSGAKQATFRGKTFVLIDATNSSAAFQFAQMVQENKLGTLVGSPTGGNRRGINGGAFFFLRLPHSKIEVDLPLIGRFLDHDVPDAGIEPDVVVEPNIADIMAGRDSELEAVKKMLSAKQGR